MALVDPRMTWVSRDRPVKYDLPAVSNDASLTPLASPSRCAAILPPGAAAPGHLDHAPTWDCAPLRAAGAGSARHFWSGRADSKPWPGAPGPSALTRGTALR